MTGCRQYFICLLIYKAPCCYFTSKPCSLTDINFNYIDSRFLHLIGSRANQLVAVSFSSYHDCLASLPFLLMFADVYTMFLLCEIRDTCSVLLIRFNQIEIETWDVVARCVVYDVWQKVDYYRRCTRRLDKTWFYLLFDIITVAICFKCYCSRRNL